MDNIVAADKSLKPLSQKERRAAEQRGREERSAYLMRGRDDLRAGRDTPEAREALDLLLVVAKSKTRGDRRVSKILAKYRDAPIKKKKKGKFKEKVVEGPDDHPDTLKGEKIIDPTGKELDLLRRGASMRGLEDHQISAFRRFDADWHAAFLDGLRGASWEAKVDGGAAGAVAAAHVRRLSAQERMRDLRKFVGPRDWVLLEVRVIYGYGPAAIHQAGGDSIDAITAQIKLALNKVAEFYGKPGRPDKTFKLLVAIVAAAARAADIARPS